jgi:UDPglucose 6-dehydrogenase
MIIGIVGLGFVGGAMLESFIIKGYINDKTLFAYDKYKDGGIGSIENILNTDIVFLALPTPYNKHKKTYEIDSLIDTCALLEEKHYSGIVIIKSTIVPTTVENIIEKYPTLSIIHNPEFLTARTAFHDFHNQTHIVLGVSSTCKLTDIETATQFYTKMYPDAEISICNSTESESMKLFVNCFYASKVQFFNEIYLLCQKTGANYDTVKGLMLKNKWISPHHTVVPGPDGKLSYGGYCFPKDTNALCEFMDKLDTPHAVLSAVIKERNDMRDDHTNII